MADLRIYAPILQNIIDWARDQVENLSTIDIGVNFKTGELQCYDYETGIIHSSRPLAYFLPL